MTTPGEIPQDKPNSLTSRATEAQARDLLRVLADEHLEGLRIESQDRAERKARAELEQRLPGLSQEFEHLIRRLTDPNSSTVISLEFPVVASIVILGPDGKLIEVASSTNQVNATGDSTAHAEIIALREAQAKSGDKHLKDHYLLSTLEPCVMCCGALVNTEVSGLVYAADHSDVEGKHALVGGKYKPYRTSPGSFNTSEYLGANPDLLVVGGFMRDEILARLKRTTVNFNEYYRDPDARG